MNDHEFWVDLSLIWRYLILQLIIRSDKSSFWHFRFIFIKEVNYIAHLKKKNVKIIQHNMTRLTWNPWEEDGLLAFGLLYRLSPNSIFTMIQQQYTVWTMLQTIFRVGNPDFSLIWHDSCHMSHKTHDWWTIPFEQLIQIQVRYYIFLLYTTTLIHFLFEPFDHWWSFLM